MNSNSALRRERVDMWTMLLITYLLVSVLHPAQTIAANKNNSPAGTVTTWGEGSFQARSVLFPEGVAPMPVRPPDPRVMAALLLTALLLVAAMGWSVPAVRGRVRQWRPPAESDEWIA